MPAEKTLNMFESFSVFFYQVLFFLFIFQFVEWRDYAKTGKTNLSPNLRQLIANFNNISKWVAAMVLQKSTAEGRAKQVKKFLQICRVSIKRLTIYNFMD